MTKVFINPGHAPNGNPDPGAVGPTGLRESDVTAKVSKLLGNYLQEAGVETYILQSDNLSEVCDAANDFEPDCFVSIHCNSFGNPAANGIETYAAEGSEDGISLARMVQENLVYEFPELTDRGVKLSNFYVLLYTDAPAILIELPFISNPDEERLLGDPLTQDKFAAAIARGIIFWN
jgi:N-acetylmuramoyl-L-alanine amidase